MSNDNSFGRKSIIGELTTLGVEGLQVLVPPDGDGADPFARDGDKYDRAGVLGSGGMGDVLLVRDRDLRREVAMKVLHEDLAAIDEQRIKFIAEAQRFRRIFRDEAIQKYQAAFELAARYTYLAAKAYDYTRPPC